MKLIDQGELAAGAVGVGEFPLLGAAEALGDQAAQIGVGTDGRIDAGGTRELLLPVSFRLE